MRIYKILGLLCCFSMGLSLSAQQFPDVQLKTLNRQAVALSDFVGQGKNTVVAVWATTCPNCIMELDHMTEYADKWATEYNAEIIAVSMDQYQRVRRVAPMVNGRNWPYTILIDNQRQLGQLLNFTTIPQLFVVNGQGEIVQQYSTYELGREKEVDRLLSTMR